MKRKKYLAAICFLLAGVCVMGIAEAQIQVHGQSTPVESAAVSAAEEANPSDGLSNQKINYESATSYDAGEIVIGQSKHTYIPNP